MAEPFFKIKYILTAIIIALIIWISLWLSDNYHSVAAGIVVTIPLGIFLTYFITNTELVKYTYSVMISKIAYIISIVILFALIFYNRNRMTNGLKYLLVTIALIIWLLLIYIFFTYF